MTGEPRIPHKTPLHGFFGGLSQWYRNKTLSFLDIQIDKLLFASGSRCNQHAETSPPVLSHLEVVQSCACDITFQ